MIDTKKADIAKLNTEYNQVCKSGAYRKAFLNSVARKPLARAEAELIAYHKNLRDEVEKRYNNDKRGFGAHARRNTYLKRGY